MSEPKIIEPINSRLILFLLGLTLIFLGLAQGANLRTPTETGQFLTIKQTRLTLQVADTPEERAQGLSGRDSLAPQTGLLFVFEEPTQPGFWMKEMNFAIDILWLDEAGTITEISPRLAPESYPQIIRPQKPVKYVLEVIAGSAEKNNWRPGDRAIIHF